MCGASWVIGMLPAPTSPCCRLSTARKMLATRFAISAKRWSSVKTDASATSQPGNWTLGLCDCYSRYLVDGETHRKWPPTQRCRHILRSISVFTWLGKTIAGGAARQQLYPAAEWRHFWAKTFQLITGIFRLMTKTQSVCGARYVISLLWVHVLFLILIFWVFQLHLFFRNFIYYFICAWEADLSSV